MQESKPTPNCCTICNRPLDIISTELIHDDVHVFERGECPRCETGCYLIIDTGDETITYDCCYCHQQP